jgi:hypothetical protein
MRAKGRQLATAVATAFVLGAIALAPSAAASPTGDYAQFAQCPYATIPVDGCLVAVIEAGSTLQIGSRTLTIGTPITLQGGYTETLTGLVFHAATGTTLSQPAEPLAGGLVGVTAPGTWPIGLQEGWNEGIEEGLTGVNATLELAAPATSIGLNFENLVTETGTALTLPLKIKLDNALLGENCFIGSDTDPIEIPLTTGTSGTQQGSAGTISFDDDFTIVTIDEAELVDTSFEVPEAEGCGGIAHKYVDPLIDSLFGIPAASGNAADFQMHLASAAAAEVDAHDP